MSIETREYGKEIRKLYNTYKNYAYAAAIKILGDRAGAEDAVQTAFENLIINFQKYKDLSCHKMINLVVIISRNAAINIYHKRRREIPSEYIEETAGYVADTLDTVISRETYNDAVKAIKSLPELYRDVFLMKHVYGNSNREIAEILGISEDTVRQRLSRARKKIAEILERGDSNAEQ